MVEKTVHFGNLLLAHFHYAARGLIPLTLNWNDEKHKELVSNDTTIITSMQAIQQHAKVLGTRSHTLFHDVNSWECTGSSLAVGQKGRDRYQENDEMSSLMSVDTVRYADFEDFIHQIEESDWVPDKAFAAHIQFPSLFAFILIVAKSLTSLIDGQPV